MALQYSTMTELGSAAHPFDLPTSNPDVDAHDGPNRTLDQFTGAPALVVVFTCNHCPYAVHIAPALVKVAKKYIPKGVQFVAISSNDTVAYPADSFENMQQRALDVAFPFPYLFDESQEVARAYGAVCTPDFFVYDAQAKLAYRGRFDETRPGYGMAHGGDLAQTLDTMLAGSAVPEQQLPSMGCSIKWK